MKLYNFLFRETSIKGYGGDPKTSLSYIDFSVSISVFTSTFRKLLIETSLRDGFRVVFRTLDRYTIGGEDRALIRATLERDQE